MKAAPLPARIFVAILPLAIVLAFQPLPTFRSESALVLLHFHVVKGASYAMDVKPEDLILLEDGVPRKFTVFENTAHQRTFPIEVTLLFDFSRSVINAGLYDPGAIRDGLLDQLDNVQVAVYGFDNKLYRFCRPTHDYNTISNAFTSMRNPPGAGEPVPYVLPNGKNLNRGTWIYASVLQTSREMAAGRNNATRILLVVSDGYDTTTMHAKSIVELIRERDVVVYPIALGHRAFPTDFHVLEYGLLGALTGGRSYDVQFLNNTVMMQILQGVVGTIRTEYIIGFSPQSSGKATRHTLEVRLRDKTLGKVSEGKRSVMH